MSTQNCRFYGSMKGCRNGNNCRFNHNNPNSIPLCRNFNGLNTSCKYGNNCSFRHTSFNINHHQLSSQIYPSNNYTQITKYQQNKQINTFMIHSNKQQINNYNEYDTNINNIQYQKKKNISNTELLISGFIRQIGYLLKNKIIPYELIKICSIFYSITLLLFVADKYNNQFFMINTKKKYIKKLIKSKKTLNNDFKLDIWCYIRNISSLITMNTNKHYDGIIGLTEKDMFTDCRKIKINFDIFESKIYYKMK